VLAEQDPDVGELEIGELAGEPVDDLLRGRGLGHPKRLALGALQLTDPARQRRSELALEVVHALAQLLLLLPLPLQIRLLPIGSALRNRDPLAVT
jgi:hypothetical protein